MEIQIQEHEHPLLPPADLLGEIERLRGKLIAEKDRHLRTMADFKNYRRRIEMDGNKLVDTGMRGIFLPLLDIVDDLEKALQWAREEESPFVQGVRMTRHKFLALLEVHGIRPFESAGLPFNPELHEAVAMVNDGGHNAGIVLDELRRGYLWKNELLRPAQVRVAGDGSARDIWNLDGKVLPDRSNRHAGRV